MARDRFSRRAPIEGNLLGLRQSDHTPTKEDEWGRRE